MVNEVSTHEEDSSSAVHGSISIYAVSVGIDTNAAIIDAHSDCRSVMSYCWVFAPAITILGKSYLRRSAIITQFVKGVTSRRHTVHAVGAILAGMGSQATPNILVVCSSYVR
jgi:hypothetical protein